MNVAAVLKAKGHRVATAPPTATLQQIAEQLAGERVGAIVVCDTETIAGIISERDIVRAIAQGGPTVLSKSVGDVMTKQVTTCHQDHSIEELMSIMTQGRFRHVPVVDASGKLLGIISIGDVVKNHIAEVEMEVTAMKGYLATG